MVIEGPSIQSYGGRDKKNNKRARTYSEDEADVKRTKLYEERMEEDEEEDDEGDKVDEDDEEEDEDEALIAEPDVESMLEESGEEEDMDEDDEEELRELKIAEDDIEEVEREEPRKEERSFAPNWEEIPTLPKGWKYRELEMNGKLINAGKRQFLMAPSGKIFPCRRLALKHMIDTRFE